jgi:pyroglutamyl-peptidase
MIPGKNNSLVCLLVMAASLLAASSGYAFQMNLLLATGFEPFGGQEINESWLVAQSLQGKYSNNTELVAEQLPVAWRKATVKLHELIRKYKPAAVISFGQSSTAAVRLETTARNQRAKLPDNEGVTPELLKIYTPAPFTLTTGLPLREIEKRLTAAGIPVVVSQDAGAYLCNETFYTLMFDPGLDETMHVPRGFIHVPPLNTVVRREDGASMIFDQETLQKVAEIVTQAVVDSLDQY